jgi:hypothetical protein
MIHIMTESKGNVLALRAVGKLTDSDYKKVLIPKLENIIKEHGKARLLLDMGDDYHGWEASALWDDTHFGLAHKNDFEKMGVIGGPKWVSWGMKLMSNFIDGDFRNFPPEERDKAIEWIGT